jgi:2'-5' RNA ligase
VRLFVALSIPEEVRNKLSSLLAALERADKRQRWADPEKLHVTIKFIGHVAPESLTAIGDALAAVKSECAVRLEFRGIGFFPNARRPNIAWVGIESSPNFVELASDVNRVLLPLAIPREEKPFVPHLTLARFRQERLPAALKKEIQNWTGSNFGTLATTEFHLMESKLKSTGAEYTTLRSFQFTPKERDGHAQ